MKSVAILFLLSASFSSLLHARPLTPVRITVEKKATIDEQLALSRKLIRDVELIEDPAERMTAVGRAAAHLEYVKVRWPHERRAFTTATLLQAELYLREKLAPTAVKTLAAARDVAILTPEATPVLRLLGQAYVALRQYDKADEAFREAEKEIHLNRLNHVEKIRTLNEISLHYRDLGRYGEAAERLERAAAIPEITDDAAAGFLGIATDYRIKAKDHPKARETFGRMEGVFQRLQRATLRDPASVQMRDAIEVEMRRLRARLNEH